MTNSRLKNAQAIAAIFAAIAVPIVVAVVGWQIQTSISSESVRKDYVQMAIGILASPRVAEDEPLRQWAVSVLDKNSPVPFSKDVRADLARGTIYIQPKVFRPFLSSPMMDPPKPWVNPPKEYTLDELVDNYSENMRRAQHNYLGLKYLQQAIRVSAELEAKSTTPGNTESP